MGSTPTASSLHFSHGAVYDMIMKNRLKIAAVVVAVIIGMVFYKNHHDKHYDSEGKKRETKPTAKAKNRPLPN